MRDFKISWMVFLAFGLGSCAQIPRQEINSVSDKSETATQLELRNYAELPHLVEQYVPTISPDKILFVFDIDTTLLKNTTALGSEQWFYWQADLLKTQSPQRVAMDFFGLLRVQGILYALDSMQLADPNAPQIIEGLQQKGFKTIVLTSRGSEFRSDTERTLEAHGLRFYKNNIGEDIAGRFLPFALKELTEVERKRVGNENPREVSYERGIFMVSGQHKGVMLRQLLKRFKEEPAVIVFVDNQEKQIGRVVDEFRGGSTRLIACRFAALDGWYRNLEKPSEQKKVDHVWKKLKSIVQKDLEVMVP